MNTLTFDEKIVLSSTCGFNTLIIVASVAILMKYKTTGLDMDIFIHTFQCIQLKAPILCEPAVLCLTV